jgi:hypothetical protein
VRLTRFASSHRLGSPTWPAWVPPAQRRRLDPLTRAACAVVEGVLQQGASLNQDTALVVSTSYGSVDSTVRFNDSIARFGDRAASPTPFTTSVHNACAGALGEFLRLHGPCTTVSQGGTGTIAALRWAKLILDADRAPTVLVVVGDQHTDWSLDLVRDLARCPWPIGSGCAAVLAEPGDGPGRELRLGRNEARHVLDGGALLDRDEAVLAAAARGAERLVAPALLGNWWPCCLLAALPWDDGGALQLREIEAGQMLECWLGPKATA